MPTCNIDSRGRAMRLIGGLVLALGGSMLLSVLFLRILVHPAWWFLAAAELLAGAFMIYEGWAGWCALRAMGIKTKI